MSLRAKQDEVNVGEYFKKAFANETIWLMIYWWTVGSSFDPPKSPVITCACLKLLNLSKHSNSHFKTLRSDPQTLSLPYLSQIESFLLFSASLSTNALKFHIMSWLQTTRGSKFYCHMNYYFGWQVELNVAWTDVTRRKPDKLANGLYGLGSFLFINWVILKSDYFTIDAWLVGLNGLLCFVSSASTIRSSAKLPSHTCANKSLNGTFDNFRRRF